MAAAVILNFDKIAFGATVTQIWSISVGVPNLKHISSLMSNDQDMSKYPKSKMAAVAILNFGKSVIFGINYTHVVNIDLRTKFGGNRPRNG